MKEKLTKTEEELHYVNDLNRKWQAKYMNKYDDIHRLFEEWKQSSQKETDHDATPVRFIKDDGKTVSIIHTIPVTLVGPPIF